MDLEEKKAQKQMAEKLLEASEDKVNRNIKDSVFCDLFGEKEYLYQIIIQHRYAENIGKWLLAATFPYFSAYVVVGPPHHDSPRL